MPYGASGVVYPTLQSNFRSTSLKPRILIVDDHQIFRASIGSLLNSKWGYEICGEAGDGLEAIEKVRDLKPDLVLLDLSMPLMGGTAAARKIRVWEPKTKIVFLSMHDSEMTTELARLAGADGSLSKRCATEELHQIIESLFERKLTLLRSSDRCRSGNPESKPTQPDQFEAQRHTFFGNKASEQK
jgi:DNA-binding NarL/FixJ family response regulator